MGGTRELGDRSTHSSRPRAGICRAAAWSPVSVSVAATAAVCVMDVSLLSWASLRLFEKPRRSKLCWKLWRRKGGLVWYFNKKQPLCLAVSLLSSASGMLKSLLLLTWECRCLALVNLRTG